MKSEAFGFKNDFSWSKTRDEVFRTCPRQYWFNYYGYWNGWFEDAPERTRQIYVLKNLRNRHIWAGEKVHECIERSLNNIRRGIKVLPVDEIVSITIDQMRAEFRSSRLRNYLKNPKSCALFEHEYATQVSDEEWKELAQHVEICLRNFYASDIFDGLKSHSREGWLEVEEFSSFQLDDFRVHLVIDCAIKEGKDIFIYDWKTGKSIPEDLPLQLSCYALYALEKWRVSPESLMVIEYNLSYNKATEFSVSQADADDMKGYIRGSVKDMRSLLTDPEDNLPLEEERFSKVEDNRISLRCNFLKICKPHLVKNSQSP